MKCAICSSEIKEGELTIVLDVWKHRKQGCGYYKRILPEVHLECAMIYPLEQLISKWYWYYKANKSKRKQTS